MSAPAVKPALSAPSGTQAPRVGSNAPNTASSNTPPGSATAAQKLPPSPVGMNVSVSPMKPSIPPSANHAVTSAVPLSLVQEHKAQGNALPQPPVTMPRTPEKPKDLVTSMAPPSGPKPTSNGVEGSPGKVPSSPVQLLPSITESKKSDDAVNTAALMNHSADTAPASAAGPISALPSTTASNANMSPSVPATPVVMSSSAASLPPIHSSGVSSQQSFTKPEHVSTSASASVGSASAAPAAPVALSSGGGGALSAAVPPAATPAIIPISAPQPLVSPPKSSANAPTTNSSSPNSKNDAGPGPAATESKAPAVPATQAEDPAPAQTPAATAPGSGPGPGVSPTAAPAPEVAAKPAPPAPPEVTKTRIEISKPEFKVATTPRVSKRKRETKPVVEAKTVADDPNDDRKSKRVRTRTQPYQSPLPELQYITKFKSMMKGADDKLIVFYKNEFLAVRNAEGSFYVCQAMQNIYKSSTRIRIRWLSQEKKENKETNVYIPDFYDVTEFDCILTNLELKKLDKNKYQLPQEERDRTQNILKRALDVEKGVGEKPPITEEHPDGLDLSLYRDEAQLKKKRSSSKSNKKAKKAEAKANKEGRTVEGETETSEESQEDGVTGESEEDGEKKKAAKTPKSKVNKKEKAVTKATAAKEKAKVARDKESSSPKKERTSERGREREATKRRAEALPASASHASSKNNAATKPPPEKKSKVSTPKPVRKAEKAEPAADASLPTRATKSRSAKSSAAATPTTAPSPSNKTSPVTRTKERERRGASASGGRKKPGKKA